MPTPNHDVIRNKPGRKAINNIGQRITKDQKETKDKEIKEAKPKHYTKINKTENWIFKEKTETSN